MAPEREYSSYQKDLIRRYYDNRDDIMVQKLAGVISDIYLCTSPKKLDRLWERVSKALLALEENKDFVKDLVARRDIEFLAKVLSTLQ